MPTAGSVGGNAPIGFYLSGCWSGAPIAAVRAVFRRRRRSCLPWLSAGCNPRTQQLFWETRYGYGALNMNRPTGTSINVKVTYTYSCIEQCVGIPLLLPLPNETQKASPQLL